jgi:hypothetical protein
MRKLSILFLLTGMFFSCKKEEEKPAAPIITFKSISATTAEEFNNSLKIQIDYEDFQGDLGESDPDNYSIRVKDARLSDFDWYHIPPVTPENKELHVKGTLSVELDPLFLLGVGVEEYTRFTVEIRDRQGNWSNMVTTPNVLIVDSL